MKELLLVFIGGGIGSALRYETSVMWKRIVDSSHLTGMLFPWPTLFVNVLGCFLISLFYQYAGRWGLSNEARLLLTTGLCGGFTTFSTFSYEGLSLIRSGNIGTYSAYLLLSIILGIVAAALPFLCHCHD